MPATIQVLGPAPEVAPRLLLRVVGESVPAGFPSPAQDYFEGTLDLNELLIQDRTSTFVARVSGDSMTGAGIFDGDRIIVDRSIDAADGHVVVAILDGEFTIKRLQLQRGGVVLRAENPAYPDVRVPELSDLRVWGTVVWNLHRHVG